MMCMVTDPDPVLAAVQNYDNIKIGAIRNTCTFRQLEIDKKDDRAFDQLRAKLGQHITTFKSTQYNVRPDDNVSQFNAIVCMLTIRHEFSLLNFASSKHIMNLGSHVKRISTTWGATLASTARSGTIVSTRSHSPHV
jgi:hypothetical protein